MSAPLKAVGCQLSKSTKRQHLIYYIRQLRTLAEYAKSEISLCIRIDIIGWCLSRRTQVIEKACEDATSWYGSNELLKIGLLRHTEEGGSCKGAPSVWKVLLLLSQCGRVVMMEKTLAFMPDQVVCT